MSFDGKNLTGSAFDGKSEDYKSGWLAGYNIAQQASMRNRDHFRAMLGKTEPYQQSIDRIYNEPKDKTGSVDSLINSILDGIDLYVVLPPLDLQESKP